jgi:hypothetical protein
MQAPQQLELEPPPATIKHTQRYQIRKNPQNTAAAEANHCQSTAVCNTATFETNRDGAKTKVPLHTRRIP